MILGNYKLDWIEKKQFSQYLRKSLFNFFITNPTMYVWVCLQRYDVDYNGCCIGFWKSIAITLLLEVGNCFALKIKYWKEAKLFIIWSRQLAGYQIVHDQSFVGRS